MSNIYLTTAEKVINGLRTAITSGELSADEQIRQEQIAAEYNVSRMPVREAFRQLEAEGLLVVLPGRGTFVNRLSDEEIHEICDMRILLECDAIQRAVPRLTPPILLDAETLLQKLSWAEDAQTFGQLDSAFHEVLYAPTQRQRQLNLIRTLRNQMNHFLYLSTPIETYRTQAIAEHKDILAACQAGNVEAAAAALALHLKNTANQCAPSKR